MTPEYLHVLLNPLPIYGLGMGAVGLALALLTGSKHARLVALVLVVLGALSAWPAFQLGEKAYMPVFMSLDADGQRWLDIHEHRAERGVYAFFVTGALALAALAADWKFPKAARPLALATLIAAVAAAGIGGWIGQAGGKVRHSEFRTGPPPPVEHEKGH